MRETAEKLYFEAKTKLKTTAEEFYSMAFTEVRDILFEYDQNNKLSNLEQAYFNSLLINAKDKATDMYKNIFSDITGIDVLKEDLDTCIKRYKMISKRLGLKYPKEWDIEEGD